MAERRSSPILPIAFAIGTIALCLAATEFAMRYLDRPRTVISGWRAEAGEGPVNQFGWRGRPWQRQPADFVVVMTGSGEVACDRCLAEEPLDLILERALRRYNPNARVITLGSTGYGQDQEYLALHEYFLRERADLVIVWTAIARDVPRNTFRSGQPRPGATMLKPTFALRGNAFLGPTETIGTPIYQAKLATLLLPLFVDIERDWDQALPPASPGAAAPPPGAAGRAHDNEPLGQQRSAWSIWLAPRPARVQYGIDLTRALLGRMRELAMLRGARFVTLRTPSPAEQDPRGTIALENSGRWFLADSAARDAAVADVLGGFSPIVLSADGGTADNQPISPMAERDLMARLAEALNQRDLLTPAVMDRTRR